MPPPSHATIYIKVSTGGGAVAVRARAGRWDNVALTGGVAGMTLLGLSFTVTIGADSMWLVALGNAVLNQGRIPQGVPFMSSSTDAWVNVPVWGEVAAALLDRLGPGALLAAQLVVVASVLVVLTASARMLGASDASAAGAMAIMVLGQLPSFGVVRAQMWSLALFATVSLLLRRETVTQSRRIWLIPPLTALWGNLHGAVLVGVAVVGAYLVLHRLPRQPRTAGAVGVLALLSLWCTPGGTQSHEYYLGVLFGAAPARGEGLWAPIDLSSGFGMLMAVSITALGAAALRRRLPAWEYAVIAGLALLTVQSARNGVWLGLWLAPLAARGFSRPDSRTPEARPQLWVRRSFAACFALLIALGLNTSSAAVANDRDTADALAQHIGREKPVLATSRVAELLAMNGVKLWAGNPLDALPMARQHAYLDFLRGTYSRAMSDPEPPAVIVVPRHAPTPPGAYPTMSVGEYVIFRLVAGSDR